MLPPTQLDPHTGQLQLSPAVRISEKTEPTDLPRLFPEAPITPYHLGNGWMQHHARTEQDGWLLMLTLTFIGRYLIEWQMKFFPADEQARSWTEWNEAAQHQQGDLLHEWLDRELGAGPRQFDWGEVRVGYDARSGSSSVLVRYGGPEPTPRPA
jgi:hypothetical protein